MNDELSELEQLAAEYVLGSLGADERRSVEEQMRRDAELARLVQEWTLRLAPIIEAVPPVAPPAGGAGSASTAAVGCTSGGGAHGNRAQVHNPANASASATTIHSASRNAAMSSASCASFFWI